MKIIECKVLISHPFGSQRITTYPEKHNLRFFYRPPPKLCDGNIFTCVCLSTLQLPAQPPASGIWWSSLETCSNLSTSGGGHRIMYGFQVASTNLSGMLYC